MPEQEKLDSLSVLIKPASSLCNLRCRYCFYEDESENRTQKCYGIMTRQTASCLIASAAGAVRDGGTVSFGFQGGEPTVAGLDFFRYFIEEEKKYPQTRFVHSIQTNGTMLNDAWADFLAENRFLVGISIDGYRDLHDANRIDAGDQGTYDRVLEKLALLNRRNVAVNALCVVTKQCTERPHRVYRRLKDLGFSYLQFIACLDPLGKERGKEPYSLLPEDYGRFLCAVFDDWYTDWTNGNYTSVRQFDDYVHILTGVAPSCCAAAGKCGTYLVSEADGSLYPCDFYVLDDWYLGNVNDMSVLEAVNSPKARSFVSENGRRPEACATCTWLPICHGGCKRDITFPGGVPENYFCESFRFFFEYASERLMEVARAELEAMMGSRRKRD